MPTSKARRARLKWAQAQQTKLQMKCAGIKYLKQDAILQENVQRCERWKPGGGSGDMKWFERLADKVPCLRALCRWCLNTLRQVAEWTQNYLFAGQNYKLQLAIALDKLQAAESELQQLKQKQLTESSSQTTSHCEQKPCCCMCYGTAGCPPPSVPPPPPPPVVPPPPPPPPPPPQNVLKPVVLKRSTTKRKLPTDKSSSPIVTMADLSKVKLRRTNSMCVGTPKTAGGKGPLVSLDNLQAMRLRKAPSGDDKENHSPSNIRDQISKEVLQFHKKLKKVEIKRSPGGTPVADHKKSLDTGSGFTPMMTRALKKKFLFAHSLTPSPCSPKESDPDSEDSPSQNQEKARRHKIQPHRSILIKKMRKDSTSPVVPRRSLRNHSPAIGSAGLNQSFSPSNQRNLRKSVTSPLASPKGWSQICSPDRHRSPVNDDTGVFNQSHGLILIGDNLCQVVNPKSQSLTRKMSQNDTVEQ